MKIIKLSVFFISAFIISGCASIAGNNSRAVRIQSNPPGAAIFVDNQQFGVTPAIVNLPNYIYGGKSITLKKRGFQDQTQIVNAKFQPIALFDVLFWPGFIIDAATGNIVKIDPANTNLNFQLQRD